MNIIISWQSAQYWDISVWTEVIDWLTGQLPSHEKWHAQCFFQCSVFLNQCNIFQGRLSSYVSWRVYRPLTSKALNKQEKLTGDAAASCTFKRVRLYILLTRRNTAAIISVFFLLLYKPKSVYHQFTFTTLRQMTDVDDLASANINQQPQYQVSDVKINL